MLSIRRIKKVLFGEDRDLRDPALFHKLSLMAFFAWIGLGTDGLSSSCYGPEEAFRVVTAYPILGMVVAIAIAATIFIICASYNQIVEVFPTGGGGYVVASKLLNPTIGMVSGCALLVDYVLTISLSISSGVDAFFSLLPPAWLPYKLVTGLFVVVLLIAVNMRGVKESVMVLVPVFLLFLVTHVFAFVYTLVAHTVDLPRVASEASTGFKTAYSQLGLLGMFLMIMKAYSMGAGTYTGIEAVSNGLPILREPKVATARKTMSYMSVSLSVTVLCLMMSYILYHVTPTPDMSKTLNAVTFEKMTAGWGGGWGRIFVWIVLFSEAILLFIAAQTGFFGGPRVAANMALDRWFPNKFAMLSNRLVTQNGIMLMGGAAIVTMVASHGDVRKLVILYSINVFITFVLSQLGMIKHWWNVRKSARRWKKGILINGIGFVLTALILASIVGLKFREGAWVTLAVTGSLVGAVLLMKRHYFQTEKLLKRLDDLVFVVTEEMKRAKPVKPPKYNPRSKTAVILVSGFNGLGLHTLMAVIRMFGKLFKNFVFVQIGVVDAGTFKGSNEIERLQEHTNSEVSRYVEYMRQNGYYSESFTAIGNDVIKEVIDLAPEIKAKFKNVVFFGGQLVFPEETVMTRWMHNYVPFTLQRRFYHEGTPFMIMPIRVFQGGRKDKIKVA